MLTLTLLGCRSHSQTIQNDTVRHSDSVSTLTSVSASTIDKVEVWETIVMERDSLGVLAPVRHDIVRHTEKATQSETRDDTAAFEASNEETYQHNEKTVTAAPNEARRTFNWFVAGIWLGFAALAAMLVAYLIKKGKGRWI